MGDSTATVVDPGARPARSATPPSIGDTIEDRLRTPATPPSLPAPESVLRTAEIEQTRRTGITGVLFNIIGLAAAALFGGDDTARLVFVICLVAALADNAWLWYVASDERRYSEGKVLAYFAIAPFLNAGVIYYLGVFGPILVMFVLNIYTTCLGYGRRVALVTLAGSVAPFVVVGSAILLGWIGDPGLMTATPRVGTVSMAVVMVAIAVFFCLVYAQARRARELMVASLRERDDAVRRASHREALFLEARLDLERALRAGGLGRFTDQILGSYKLGAVLGRGGMGEIYEATHVTSGEPAAVKMLLPEVLGLPQYVRRFLREVRIAASLDSPHVVRVLEVGDESAALPYLAMERLRGEDLAQILRREERLEPARVVELVRQVGRGLAVAATAGIVHRDLKPQNLMFADGVWKILDFGVSKLVEHGGTLTEGEAIGTPHYMAPEQARGGEVDARTDLYALGAIAYRSLTGHPPFKGGSPSEVLLAVISTMPVRPSALAALPRDVDAALALAMAKRPDDRFDSADRLADALEAALAERLDDTLRKRAARLVMIQPWRDAEIASPRATSNADT